MRNVVSVCLCLSVSLLFLGASEPAAVTKPNIVLLLTDDLTYRAIHALGNGQVKTPNIDRLAASGATFTHAYNMGGWNGAICTASRSMLIGGRFLWRTNQYRQQWSQHDSVALANTWPKMMERAGYDTYMTGKWHVDAPAERVFMTTAHIRAGMPKDAYGSGKMTKAFAAGSLTNRNTFANTMPNGYNRPLSATDSSWSPTDRSKGGYWEGGKHWSEVAADDALGFIGRAAQIKNTPFFMYVAFNAAHDPRQSPGEFLDMYPLESIQLPASFQPDYPYHQEIGVGPQLRDEALAPFPRTPLAIKTHLREYYALISHLDAQIGKIMDDLRAKGLLENTYVFFTSDHGLAVGRHGLLGKQNMYDHSLRPPLLMAGPGVKPGMVVEQDVYYQDIMPTALALAGIQKPAFVEFNSLLPLANGIQSGKSYPAIYGAYTNTQRMIRQDGFKLIAYPKADKFLLFDLTKDPEEMTNLADKPDYKAKKKTLFRALLALQTQQADTLNLTRMSLQ